MPALIAYVAGRHSSVVKSRLLTFVAQNRCSIFVKQLEGITSILWRRNLGTEVNGSPDGVLKQSSNNILGSKVVFIFTEGTHGNTLKSLTDSLRQPVLSRVPPLELVQK
jgi:hypothetical protein